MLSYTFSKREKALIVLLALIAIAILWYQLIFKNAQESVARVDSEIEAVQDEMIVDTAKAGQIDNMRAAIQQYKTSGINPVEMPNYDNVQPLMAQLNGTLAPTLGYTLKFEDVTSGDSDTVRRGVELSYGCSSYQEARVILNALVHGVFPCSIDDFTLTDNTAKLSAGGSASNAGSGSSNAQPYAVTAHLTFYEKGHASGASGSEDDSSSESAATSLAEGMGMVSSSTSSK
jgi:hypothetical protein